MILNDTAHFLLFSLILMRMSGFILLNPILGRRNIPAIVKAGFIMILTLLIYSFAEGNPVEVGSSLEYGILLMKEFAVGFFIGFVMQLFTMVVTYAGGIIDFQMGLSMAMIYDAQNNAQIPLTGSLLNTYFMLLFFAVDGHLALMKILITSASVVPYGEVAIAASAGGAVLDIFIACIVLAVKLSFPILAVELITEVGVGILMKMIPQINVFVINIQLKITIGLIMLVILFVPMSDFLGNMITTMMNSVQDVLKLLRA